MKRKILLLACILIAGILQGCKAANTSKLELKKASPYSAVKWVGDEPMVKFEDQWYELVSIDQFSKAELLKASKTFGIKWRKRFSEDLIELFATLNYTPCVTATLKLRKDGVTKTFTTTYTKFKRRQCWGYNQTLRANMEAKADKQNTEHAKAFMPTAKALEDLKQFDSIISNTSSYVQLSDYPYHQALTIYSKKIASLDSVNVGTLSHDLAAILAEIGDRHASIKEPRGTNRPQSYYLRLPFGLVVLNGKLAAVTKNEPETEYRYLHNDFPYLSKIQNMPIESFMDKHNYKDKNAPQEAKLARAAEKLVKIGKLLYKSNSECPKQLVMVFSNGASEKKVLVDLVTNKKWSLKDFGEGMLKNSLKTLEVARSGDIVSKLFEGNIAYLNIPKMEAYEREPNLEAFLHSTLEKYADTKALIIDLRGNPGGRRDLIHTFASYLIQPEQSPWVANVAYLRVTQPLDKDEESMTARSLHTFNSKAFSETDRMAIDKFMKGFQPAKAFDKSKFSSPFYMLLRSGEKSYTQPVYILVDERCFSASTVFTAAFNGLPNVKIVGVRTDGSSGNSRRLKLRNSGIRIKISTMLSFQRDGLPLDGHGTAPGMTLTPDEKQRLTDYDSQLMQLIHYILK